MTVDLCQWMTPFWVAERLLEAHFPPVSRSDYGLEPTCGSGAFLRALPGDVPAHGVEIDPVLAERAHRETGRPVIVGDVLRVDLPFRPTFVVGNPPYRARFMDALLERLHGILPADAPVGLLLPAYFFQNDARVTAWSRQWGMDVKSIPKTAFTTRMAHPLCWAVLSRGRAGSMVGLALYEETVDQRGMPEAYRRLLRDCEGSSWREVVTRAVVLLGGEAPLQAIYERVGPERPSGNPWWQEKVRQQCQMYLEKAGPGRYRVPGLPPFELVA